MCYTNKLEKNNMQANDKEHNNNSLTQQIRTVIISKYEDDKNIQTNNKQTREN